MNIPTTDSHPSTSKNIPPGYQQTEVGVIPEDWEVKKAGEIIDLLTGFPFPSSRYSSDGIKLLRGSNIKRGVIDWSPDITKYWPLVDSKVRDYLLHEGDIVVAMDGSLVGRSFTQLSPKDLPALLLQRVARIRSSKADINYLSHHICSPFFTAHCDAVKTVSAIPHISPTDIKSFLIPLPPTLAEQQAIAEALSDMDALIAGQERLIAKKRLIKQGAMQELLTGQRRVAGFGAGMGYQQTEVGRIPEDWEVRTYGEMFEIRSTATYSRAMLSKNGPVGYVHYGDIHTKWSHFLDLDKVELPKIQEDQLRAYSLIQEGDLIMADASEDYEGIGASDEVINLRNKRAISGLHTVLLREKVPFAPGFKGYLHCNKVIKAQMDRLATGLKVYGLSRTNLLSIKIPLPTFEEQRQIAEILQSMDAEILQLEAQLAKYRQLKQGMMQELLTGKTRLI